VLRDVIRDVLPLIENITESTIAFNAVTAPVAAHRTIPKFVNRNRTTALAVNPAALVIETTTYDGYETFRELISTVIGAVVEVLRPDGITRVGLRYIDEIRVPSVTELPGDWEGYIDNHFLATVDRELLEETGLTPEVWQGFVRYSTGPDCALQVRYGPAVGYAVDPSGPTRRLNPPPATPFFLLDSDSFWEPKDEIPEFTLDAVLDAFDRLHPPTRSIFNAVSEPKLVEEVYSRDLVAGARQ
jgi:uncharacterized protein (TIGR04255 family)